LITESGKLLADKETTMEENNNVRTVGNVRLGFIEQLLDVEELESKLAPEGPIVIVKPV
jgi:hypothetical protein